jgi:hypothetical protein
VNRKAEWITAVCIGAVVAAPAGIYIDRETREPDIEHDPEFQRMRVECNNAEDALRARNADLAACRRGASGVLDECRQPVVNHERRPVWVTLSDAQRLPPLQNSEAQSECWGSVHASECRDAAGNGYSCVEGRCVMFSASIYLPDGTMRKP